MDVSGSRGFWGRLSIRWQLLALLTLALGVVQAGSLVLTYWFDEQDRKSLALEQADTLGRALQHDLVKVLVDAQADVYSDISFRLNGFNALAAMALISPDGTEVFRHEHSETAVPEDLLQNGVSGPHFSENFLYVRQPVVVDGYRFGEAVYLLDLSRYRTQLRERLRLLLLIFPLELLLGLGIAWTVSRIYTRPFMELAEAMGSFDIQSARYQAVKTGLANEISVLYTGYNRMIERIVATTGELKHQSEHDSLTGRYNRYAIEQALSGVLAQEASGLHVLLSVDVDQFKYVNDTAGHVAGDELLRQVGEVFHDTIPEQAMLARVGGDDFFVLCPVSSEAQGVDLARDLVETLGAYRFNWQGQVFAVSATAGLVVFRPFEYTLQALLTAVDTAFYVAKARGRGQVHAYRPDDDKVQQYSADVKTVAMLRDALRGKNTAFELHAQAIVPLARTSDAPCYEILLRLRNAEGELIPPGAFLPTAERYQMMVDIDTMVLWRYLEKVCAHPEHIEELAFVNINLAGATLNNSNFQAKVHEAVRVFDFPWNKLVLEVTETSAVGNLGKATDFIAYCRSLGIRVALDDFGTGMASFEYLKHLPLDVVKIDGSFIRDMLDDPVDHAMVSYAHEISRLRGQDTIAEFIENEAQLAALRAIGIDYGQGYYLGRPTPLDEWLGDADRRSAGSA